MKIACVGYLHGSGGAERQIIMLANDMAKRGHEVHLIILVENKSFYSISEKVIVHDLSDLEIEGKLKLIRRYSILKNELAKISPDLSIHFWLQSAYMCAMMPSQKYGKVIYAERGDPGDKEYDGLLGVVRGISFKKMSGFVFQSEGARDYFGKSISSKSIVIHNSISVDFDKYSKPCDCREKKIVNIGRLHEQKNQKLLINAFAKIADRIPDYVLEIYGEGELKEELEEIIRKHNLEQRVYLRGTTSNILEKLYNASLFVLSSDYEGMPNALMEAMAIGVPSISTNCRPGGAASIITNGKNGWITPVGDCDELANRIFAVIIDSKTRERVAQESMKIRDNHSQEHIFGMWETFFHTVANMME